MRLWNTLFPIAVVFVAQSAFSNPAPPPPQFFEGVCVVCPANPQYGSWGIYKDGKIIWGHSEEFKNIVGATEYVVIDANGKVLLTRVKSGFENFFHWPSEFRIIKDEEGNRFTALAGKLVPFEAEEKNLPTFAFWHENRCWVRNPNEGGFETLVGPSEQLFGLGNMAGDPHFKTGYGVVQKKANNSKESRWGLFDLTSRAFVVEPQFDYIDSYPSDMVAFLEDERWSYFNIKNQKRIEANFEWAYFFSEDKAFVSVGEGKGGVIDRTGRILFEIETNFGSKYRDLKGTGNIAFWRWADSARNWGVYRNGRMWLPDVGLLDQKGDLVTPSKLKLPDDYVLAASMGELISISTAVGKMGYANQDGKVVVEPKWEVLGDFSEGKAFVQNGDKYGFINASGKVVIGPFTIGEALER